MSEIKFRKFGCLRTPLEGKFLGIKISPLSDFKKRILWFEEESNRDGFFYPPQVATYKIDPETSEIKEKIKKSERPASVFKITPSHKICVSEPNCKLEKINSDEVLMINLLSYLYGTRLQFSDWNMEGRIPFKSQTDIVISDDISFGFLEHVYSWWRDLNEISKMKYINILYVLGRARSLEWEWEKFAYQYMVFDAIYNLFASLNPLKIKKINKERNITHKMRFEILISHFSLPKNNCLVDRIYRARNKLFHEAIWAETMFGHKSNKINATPLSLHLNALNSRFICGLTEFKNDYSTSEWWTRQEFGFNKPL